MRRIGWLFIFLLLAAISAAVWGENTAVNPLRLYDKQYDFWDADWAPDGQTMALAGKLHSESMQKARIWLYTPAAKQLVRWTATATFSDDWPRWSLDGKTLALVRRELTGERRTCVWLKNKETGAGQRLSKGPDDRQPSWSPDSQAVVFRRGMGPLSSVIAIFDLTTNKLSTLPLPSGLYAEPNWGGDGVIYFTQYQLARQKTQAGGQTYEIEVICGGRIWGHDPAKGTSSPVMAEDFDQRMPVLSPDGRHLAFLGQRGSSRLEPSIPDPKKWALFVREMASGKITELTTNVELTGGPPSWTKDSAAIQFYSLRDNSPALWIYTLPVAVPPKENG